MNKLYQFRGGTFVYGNKDYLLSKGDWLLTIETDAELSEDTIFKLMCLPKDMQMTEQKKPNFIARMFM